MDYLIFFVLVAVFAYVFRHKIAAVLSGWLGDDDKPA